MAVTLDFAAVTPAIVVSYVDNNLNVATTTHYPPAGTAHADVLTAAARLGAALDTISTAEIEKVTVTYEGINTAVGVPPPASNVKDKLHLGFKSSSKRSNYSFDLPSPSTAAEQVGTDVANQAEAGLAALIDEVLNGLWGANNGLRTATNFDLTSLRSAYYSVRNREPNR